MKATVSISRFMSKLAPVPFFSLYIIVQAFPLPFSLYHPNCAQPLFLTHKKKLEEGQPIWKFYRRPVNITSLIKPGFIKIQFPS